MNKKLQVFVSSTFTDLQEERQAAVEAILDAGHIPAGMELFKAGKSQMKTIQKWIDESDVYMLILGGRYGSIEEESGLSYTELEYRYALSKNMPVFAIILDESFLFTKASSYGKNAIFEKDNINKYKLFKKYVETNIVKFAKNLDNITSIIHSQLNTMFNDDDYILIGWTRNITNNDFITLLNENNLLKKHIQELQSEIEEVKSSSSKFFPYDFVIKSLKLYTYEYYNHTEINAFNFFISNYNKLQQGYISMYNDKTFSILLDLREFDIVQSKKQIDLFFLKDDIYIFRITTYGELIYKYVTDSQ